ncbi:MAG: putative nucleic acid-binding Zn-ribbon protein [Haloarculaceae archaeon]|jgi:predicted  nucleic acid-binding Zn-ribbon protein
MFDVAIENIAGIRSGEAEIHQGVNVVKAENWQGKSSFMAALQVSMGTTGWAGTGHPLTDGAGEGHVRLETETGTDETRLVRSGDTVTRQGDVYLTDEQDRTCARLFAFLGENNPIREAVRTDGDLASLLTKPLDIENIDERLDERKRERQSVETELDRAEDAAERLTAVQRTITQLEGEIEELQAEREEVADDDRGTENPEHEQLSSKRAKTEQLENQIETLQNKIDRQETRLEERREELADITIPDEPELTADIEEKQAEIAQLETNVTLLEDLHRVNKRVLDEGKAHLVTDVERTLAGDEIECWLCGESTSESGIADRLATINDRIEAYRNEKTTLETEVDEIQNRRREIQQQRRRQTDLESEISELEVTLEENRSRLADLEDRREAVTADLEQLRETVEETNSQLTDLESEIKYKENELEETREQLERLEREASQREHLQERHEELTAEIESLRLRRKEKKRELAERFEETMGEIITTLEPGFESARLTPITDAEGQITEFELVVAREGRETSLDALSEGEVELLGIVTALAGYETFDVSDRVPIILLDGLTALSNANYHAVVAYLREKTDCLVTTAYPELDDFDGHTISPHDWDVVSNRQPRA